MCVKELSQLDTLRRQHFPDKGFNCNVVIRALPSLQGGSLEITHTVPLSKIVVL